jgi:hypothetical protein
MSENWQPDRATQLDGIVNSHEKRLDRIEHDLEEKYITRESFTPVKSIVYGMVAALLLGLLSAIISLVTKRP